jgi:hypothetical protein
MLCQGGGGFFLYNDITDNVVGPNGGMLDVTPASTTPMASVGNGTSKIFQIARTIGGLGWDVIQNPTISTVTVNGTPTSAYALSTTGVLTFTSAPANNAVLAWTGGF